MPIRKELANLKHQPKILLLGSGGLSIGQAGEFDYSGTQAVKALTEEGMHVVIVNPNIATVQTNPTSDDTTIYLYPVEPHWVKKVIEKEKPDAIVAGFGGQTALNCLIELHDSGVLKKHNVLNLGTSVETLKMSEDREEFAEKMKEIGIPTAPSEACETIESAIKAANAIGYPVIARAAYALGGLGSGFAHNDDELRELVDKALASSPQVLIEKSLRGWKEVEYEVMRDSEGNIITICNMENFDPLGIHTGDSIVVCPSQSLSDDEYQLLRNSSLTMIEALGVVGECNAQFALDPFSHEYFVIEVNARLSRSSALASKASGYPIAYIAAKVVLGFDLLELKNPVTGVTFAYFEPALDYVTIKMPRWDLQKFKGASRLLGSTMKSVGEIMSIGRTFPEALQKAVRMVSETSEGFGHFIKTDPIPRDILVESLDKATDTRLFTVIDAVRQGMSIDEIYEISAIDKWFLAQIKTIVDIEENIKRLASEHKSESLQTQFIANTFEGTEKNTWRLWKSLGFSDMQIAGLALRENKNFSSGNESSYKEASLIIRRLRTALGVTPVVKKIDTTAGEYPSPSNYLYVSYAGEFSDKLPDDGKVFSAIVLGGGAYRIGTSVEFDWCAVSCSKKLQEAGWRSIIINCNPETVSTDYNSSDRLYFEELSLERILDISEFENSLGVIASMGGQLPNKLALPLSEAGIKLLGHSPKTIDSAEDRSKFSAILDKLEIDQPRWVAATSKEEVDKIVEEVGFPVLVRPSYVLSGAAMSVSYDRESLDRCLGAAEDISTEHPVVISEFLEGAREVEMDGVARNGKIVTAIVSEHVENAGVHSGDATTVVPAQKLYVETVRQVKKAGAKLAEGLNLNGPFNIQFLAKANRIKVIECNARAARSFPFISKVVGLNLADVATDVIIGKEPKIERFEEDMLPNVGVKAAMFSFKRLAGADPTLGVEMASTGEVGCIGENFDHALLLALEATGVKAPKKGVLVSAGTEKDKLKFLEVAEHFTDLGIPLYATKGTADFLTDRGFKVESVSTIREGKDEVVPLIKAGKIDFVINIPKNNKKDELSAGAHIRQNSIRFGCSLLTNMEKAEAFSMALYRSQNSLEHHDLVKLDKYLK